MAKECIEWLKTAQNDGKNAEKRRKRDVIQINIVILQTEGCVLGEKTTKKE